MKKPKIGASVIYIPTPSDNVKINTKVQSEYQAEIINVNLDDDEKIHLDSNVDLLIIFPDGPVKMPEMKVFNCSQGTKSGQWHFVD